jgi:hypothetical protein
MKLVCTAMPAWPSLAWLARGEAGTVHLLHGPGVEVRDDWFVEGAWAGEFSAGGFDRTDVFAGSGGRVRDGAIVFASSGNTVDRLVSVQRGDTLFVSNSLAALVARAGAVIDPTYPRYYEDFTTIVRGLKRYKAEVESSIGSIWLTYFGEVRWDGRTVTRGIKPVVRRDFGDFSAYRRFLSETMGLVVANARAPERRTPLGLACTVSSGYDSPTVAVLAREAGCEEAICVDRDQAGLPEDGAGIARRLGLSPRVVDREAWRALDAPEPPFLAADGTAEAIFLASARDQLRGRIVFTGYHGDKMWDKKTANLSDEVVRGDASGVSLSEFRLHTGFVNCPVAFWGVRQIGDVNAVSKSPEMAPWDVPGPYSRPICRRIVETAGVPREWFGQDKHVAAIAFNEFLTAPSMSRYRRWIADNRREWIRRGRVPPITHPAFEGLVERGEASFDHVVRRLPVVWRWARYQGLDRPGPLRRYAFAWALGLVAARYA